MKKAFISGFVCSNRAMTHDTDVLTDYCKDWLTVFMALMTICIEQMSIRGETSKICAQDTRMCLYTNENLISRTSISRQLRLKKAFLFSQANAEYLLQLLEAIFVFLSMRLQILFKIIKIRKNSRLSLQQRPDNPAPDFGCPDEDWVALNIFYEFCQLVGFDLTFNNPISFPLFSQFLKCCK